MVRSASFGPDALIWIAPVTKVFLNLERSSCSMSLDGDASFLTDDMEHALLSHVTDLVDRHFPKLKVNLKAVMNPVDIFVAWSNWERTEPGAPQRGIVVLWIFNYSAAGTLLNLRPPRDGTSLNPPTSL